MKRINNITDILFPFLTAFYTIYNVNAGNICKTVFGCTMLLMWFWIFRKEN